MNRERALANQPPDPAPDATAGAEAYEALHVPALFGEWAEPVLDAAGVGPGHRVHDLACGTGVLARAALARVGREGAVAGVDPDPGMLAVAGRIEPAVDWKAGAAEAIPFPDAAFDAVVSQFGMMFFADRHAAAAEILRVLAPGGRLAVAVWDALENAPAYAAEVELLHAMAGPDAADALRAPFALGDPATLAAPFHDAGAADVRVEPRTGTARFPAIRAMVGADLRGWLPLMGVDLPEPTIQEILDEADRVLAPFTTPDGRAIFDAPALLLSARRKEEPGP